MGEMGGMSDMGEMGGISDMGDMGDMSDMGDMGDMGDMSKRGLAHPHSTFQPVLQCADRGLGRRQFVLERLGQPLFLLQFGFHRV